MNTLIRSLFPLFFIAIALQVPGCATMNSTSGELQSIAENEGIVIGSLLLVAAEVDANESGWAALKGRKASELEYQLQVSQSSKNSLNDSYYLVATPGEEVFYVKKLKAGRYQIQSLKPTGLFAPNDVIFGFNLMFDVLPQQTIYIGKLEVKLPSRIGYGAPFSLSVRNDMYNATTQLRNDYPSLPETPLLQLAGIGE